MRGHGRIQVVLIISVHPDSWQVCLAIGGHYAFLAKIVDIIFEARDVQYIFLAEEPDDSFGHRLTLSDVGKKVTVAIKEHALTRN